MNSCVLIARVQKAPELRKTQDGQTLTEMTLVFDGGHDNEMPSMLKAIAWGNLAEEVYHQYSVGDRVILSGRLKMMTVEREDSPGGYRFKEKRAELTISSLEKLSGMAEDAAAPAMSEARPSNVIPLESYNKPVTSEMSAERRNRPTPEPATVAPKSSAPIDDADLDEIPF